MNFRIKEKDHLQNLQKYDRVIYIPTHAHCDSTHPDCEIGFVNSIATKTIFVKFVPQLAKFGWDGTTSQACDPLDLRKLTGHWPQVTS